MKKHWKIISSVCYWTVFSILLLSTIIVISTRASGGEPELFGYQLKTVLSGSMEPTFNTGSIILVKKVSDPNLLEVNDVVTFREGRESIVTHRVIDKVQAGDGQLVFTTKGDNNENADTSPVLGGNIVAKYTGFSVPFIGYFFSFAGSPMGTAILLIIPGILLLAYSIITIRQAIKEIEEKAKAEIEEKAKQYALKQAEKSVS